MASATESTEAPQDSPDDRPPTWTEFGFGLQSQDVVPVVAALSGLAAALSGQQPTGNVAADVVITFAFAAAVAALASIARSQMVLMAAVLALFLSGLQMPSVALAIVAALGAVVVTSLRPFDADSQAIGQSVSGAFATHAALNLPDIGFTASASLLAAMTVAPIVVTGLQRLPAELRRPVKIAATAIAVYAILAAALTGIAALSARSQVEAGIAQAQDGVEALQQGDQPRALSLLKEAQANFEDSSDRLGGPMTWPSRFVPVVAQHSRALETAANQGTALATTAARTVTQADVDKIRGQNGAIDLQVVEAVNAELSLANSTLIAARQSLIKVNTPWLLPQLSSRLNSVDEELVAAGADIDLANHATSVMPAMLGANGPRRYMVLFIQPSESREFGGLVGAYGLLQVDQGKFDLVESGSIDTDLGSGEAQLTNPTDFPEGYARIGPNTNPQNLTATVDFTTIAAAVRDLAPQWREDPNFRIDGVLALDPYALAGLLELTGPLVVDGRAEPIGATNVVDFLLRDQYLEFDGSERDVRQDVLRVLAGQAFEQLFQIEIPGPERLGAIFGPVARADRLSMATFDENENAFLDRVFLSADLPEVGSAVDMLGVYAQTASASKLDGYATRATTYEVVVNPETGQVRGELRIVDSNNAPADADSYILGVNNNPGPVGEQLDVGANLLSLSLYTRATVDSYTASSSHLLNEVAPAFSYQRHPIVYVVPLGGSTEITATLTSQVEPGRYDIFIPAQASANVAEFTLIVRPTDGWRVSGPTANADGTWSETFDIVESRPFTFLFEPAS